MFDMTLLVPLLFFVGIVLFFLPIVIINMVLKKLNKEELPQKNLPQDKKKEEIKVLIFFSILVIIMLYVVAFSS